MEDNNNSSSDDEIKNTEISKKINNKKLKLNDGSSQDSFKGTASSSKGEKEENVDSGISADKSESTSSEERGVVAAEGPSNEVVNIAPSGSNIRTILFNIRRPKRGRNYRKRKTPGRDSDSNDSSRDSDDISVEEEGQGDSNDHNNSNSDADTDVLLRIMDHYVSEGSISPSTASSPDSNDSYETDMLIHSGGDTDSDNDGFLSHADISEERIDAKDDQDSTPVLKSQPKHNYLILRELINREMGLTFPAGKETKADVMFEKKFYGSLHAVYRLEKSHSLVKHRGCVNAINFHPEGKLFVSGSDDQNIVIWDWARNVALQTIKTGHKSNVFQSKFLHLNARSQLNIVTCARDGQVRLIQCGSSGGASVSRRRLASHSRAAHKLHTSAAEPHVVLSAGEDALVVMIDVRDQQSTRLFQLKEKSVAIPLYSISGHPLDSRQILLAGRDKFLRVFDRRKCNKPVAMYCPSALTEMPKSGSKKIKFSMLHLTCAVYNHDGTEILGSYNDENIYLFDTKNDVYNKETASEKDGYTRMYSGHRNSATFKSVSYFGPESEYVVSGSDCAHIYVWDKNSEAIVQWLNADEAGVVNCIERHPRYPVLASSGLDRDVKIWLPTRQQDPDFEGLEQTVRDNRSTLTRSPLFNDFLPAIYSAWRGEARQYGDVDPIAPLERGAQLNENVCTLC